MPILWIPGLCFYGIFVCANTYVSAFICVSYAFSLGHFLLFVLSDFCLIAFISLVPVCFLRETDRVWVQMGEEWWGFLEELGGHRIHNQTTLYEKFHLKGFENL